MIKLQLDLHHIPGAMTESGAMPRPNWAVIDAEIRNTLPRAQWNEAYCLIARQWVQLLQSHLGGEYQVLESPEVIYLSSREKEERETIMAWTERARVALVEQLGSLAWKGGLGKHVILDFEECDDFDAYLRPELRGIEEVPYSAGMCVNSGYIHIALNTGTEHQTRVTICHELTHNLLTHLHIPQWIEEGIARVMEDAIADYREPRLDVPMMIPFFRKAGLDAFWDGFAFYRRGDETHVWYELAELFVRRLNGRSAEHFDRFVQAAKGHDAGDWAARQFYGMSLGELMTELLGPGEWAPRII